MLACELAGHLRVAMDHWVALEPLCLYGSCGKDSLAYDSAALGRKSFAKFGNGHRRNLDMQVDAVHKRSADFVEVATDGTRRTGTFDCGMVVIAARAGVHGRDEHEGGRVFDGILGATNSDVPFLHRLTQDFERSTLKFR